MARIIDRNMSIIGSNYLQVAVIYWMFKVSQSEAFNLTQLRSLQPMAAFQEKSGR